MSFSPEQLSDIECIRNVGRRYSHALDRLDADGMRAVYWPDAHDDHGHEESEGVDDAEGLAAVDLLSGVKSLGFLADRGGGTHRAGIDNAGRRGALAPFFQRELAMGQPLFVHSNEGVLAR